MRKIAILSIFTIFLFGQSSKQDDILRSKFEKVDFDDITYKIYQLKFDHCYRNIMIGHEWDYS